MAALISLVHCSVVSSQMACIVSCFFRGEWIANLVPPSYITKKHSGRLAPSDHHALWEGTGLSRPFNMYVDLPRAWRGTSMLALLPQLVQDTYEFPSF